MDCHPDAAHQLDFDNILTILSQFCLSTEGAHFIAQRTFLDDEAKIEDELSLVQAARELLKHIKSFSKDSFPNVTEIIDALSDQRAEPTTTQLYHLARYLSSMSLLCTQALERKVNDNLQTLFNEIPILDHLSEYIFSMIDEDGELIIENIDILDTIQQQRMDAAREVGDELERIYHRNTTYYQSSSPVIRSNRFCLALNVNFLGKVPSVVIDQSASENTLFIEPIPCVQMNNRWIRYSQRFENEYRAFVEKIINRVKEAKSELKQIIEKFSFLDSILARAHFSKKFECHPAAFTTGNMALRQVRHPLLGATAVPIEISPNANCHVTVISGPNGGGKTVTLKTIGLVILMHYFAMHIPAAEGSRIPHCDNLLLLIGDQQSIQSKQSSFTAHVQQISRMTTVMNSRSIVLFDELGGNTDPEEGVALASAILSYCLTKKAHTFVTTHFTQLKEEATKHEQMELISMEYDHEQNKPRFVIINGLSEGSHALQVAEAAGLDSAIVKKARSLLTEDAVSYKNLLAKVTKERQQQLLEQRKLLEHEDELKGKERDLERRENHLRFKYIAEIEKLISSSRAKLERLISQVREKNISLPTKEIHSELTDTNRKLSEQAQQLKNEIILHEDESKDDEFQVGDIVCIGSGLKSFTITRIINEHTAEVSNGKLRMKVSLSRLTTPEQGEQEIDSHKRATVHISPPREPFSPVLDIRGRYTTEVEDLILKQIDDTLYNSEKGFVVVHGIGGGTLKKEVALILNQNSDKLSWRYADPNEGGHGKTIVTFRKKNEA